LTRLRKRIERATNAATYTDAALTVPADQAIGSAGSRTVTTIPDYDPVKAKDQAWRQTFKKNRARQNEEALELLNRNACRGRAQLATNKRDAELLIPTVHPLPVIQNVAVSKEFFEKNRLDGDSEANYGNSQIGRVSLQKKESQASE
jgi:hypothetical protein